MIAEHLILDFGRKLHRLNVRIIRDVERLIVKESMHSYAEDVEFEEITEPKSKQYELSKELVE